jgi:hypothetical protein
VSSSGSGATMASPPLASSMVQNAKIHASPSKVRSFRCSRQSVALVVFYPCSSLNVDWSVLSVTQ